MLRRKNIGICGIYSSLLQPHPARPVSPAVPVFFKTSKFLLVSGGSSLGHNATALELKLRDPVAAVKRAFAVANKVFSKFVQHRCLVIVRSDRHFMAPAPMLSVA